LEAALERKNGWLIIVAVKAEETACGYVGHGASSFGASGSAGGAPPRTPGLAIRSPGRVDAYVDAVNDSL
jgi:hypothetical protein